MTLAREMFSNACRKAPDFMHLLLGWRSPYGIVSDALTVKIHIDDKPSQMRRHPRFLQPKRALIVTHPAPMLARMRAAFLSAAPMGTMSYKFKAGESFAKGLRRIASNQSEKAGACLASAEDVHKGVHEVRKSIKRLRALLRLYWDAAPQGELHRIDQSLREMGRSLSGTRELQGLLDGIASLEERFGEEEIAGPLEALRTELQQKQAADADNEALRARSKSLAADFDLITVSIGELQLADDGFDAIRQGLERTYRKSRQWQRRAYADATVEAASDETFHEWRKNVQRHWRHMQLLSAAWPRELKTRADLCHAIGETIGRDHDLAVLEAHLRTRGRHYGPALKVRTARQCCRTLQAELRESVRVDGERLFLEKASAFSDRMARYWRLARQEKRAAAAVEAPDGKTP